VNAGWIPVAVDTNAPAGPVVEWCRFGETRFAEPFFEQTVRRARARPFNLAFRPRTALEEETPGPLPAGLIFHLSRCGSTLVGRMLAALPETVVLSEPPPVDHVMRARAGEEARARWLRALVAAFTHGSGARRLFIKLDAWHALELPLFARAFPDVPWIFLYRDPLEVLVSHARQMSWMMAAANAPDLLGVSVPDAMRIPRAEYHARVLARICEHAVRHAGGERFVSYAQLPDAALTRIPALFGLAPSDAERAAMRAVATYHAKLPQARFVPDAAEKQDAADPEVRAAAERWLMPLYARLEAARRSAAGEVEERFGPEREDEPRG
jgi:hypothetical protein